MSAIDCVLIGVLAIAPTCGTGSVTSSIGAAAAGVAGSTVAVGPVSPPRSIAGVGTDCACSGCGGHTSSDDLESPPRSAAGGVAAVPDGAGTGPTTSRGAAGAAV